MATYPCVCSSKVQMNITVCCVTLQQAAKKRTRDEKIKRKNYEVKTLKSELADKERELDATSRRLVTLEASFVSIVKPQHHGLSQQGVWVPFWTPKPLKRTPQDTQIFLCGISKNPNLKLKIEFFHLLIIPMTFFNNIMPYLDEFIHVYG